MKKIVGCVLCLVMLLCISACGYNPSDNTNSTNVNNNSSELSDKEKYDNAVAFFTEKKYQEAIGILENIDYGNSKDLKKSISYVYACELFNKQEFSTAYDYFKKSEDYLDSQKKLNMSAYYEGVKLVNNNQQGRSIDWFRKTLGDIEYSSLSKQHIITITASLISSGWIGTYYDDGATAQIEFKYFKNSNNLYIGWADKSDGYRFLSSLEGPLSIGAEYCTFSPKRLNESMKFKISFDSNDDMYIYSDDETTRQLMGGSYTSKGTCLYEIAIENYPVLTVPEIDINGNNKNSNSSDESVSASSTESSVSKVNENSATSTNTNSSNNDNKGTNSKPDNSNNNTSSKPGNTNINNNISSKPSTSHTHSYSKATCTKPATCSCGATTGSTLGHKWKNITKEVFVKEKGHWEDSDFVKRLCYQCDCGLVFRSDKTDEINKLRTHLEEKHPDRVHKESNGFTTSTRYDFPPQITKDFPTFTKWVVDEKSHYETEIIGKECERCGKTES